MSAAVGNSGYFEKTLIDREMSMRYLIFFLLTLNVTNGFINSERKPGNKTQAHGLDFISVQISLK